MNIAAKMYGLFQDGPGLELFDSDRFNLMKHKCLTEKQRENWAGKLRKSMVENNSLLEFTKTTAVNAFEVARSTKDLMLC